MPKKNQKGIYMSEKQINAIQQDIAELYKRHNWLENRQDTEFREMNRKNKCVVAILVTLTIAIYILCHYFVWFFEKLKYVLIG